MYDSHSYEQDPEAFRAEQQGLAEGRPTSYIFFALIVLVSLAQMWFAKRKDS